MNVTHSHDGFFAFYRSRKFVFKKKLEALECRENDMSLVLVFPNGNSTTKPTLDYSSIGYPIQNRYDFH